LEKRSDGYPGSKAPSPPKRIRWDALSIRLWHAKSQPYFSFLTKTRREMLLKYNKEAKG
jgi:hypothetical protein